MPVQGYDRRGAIQGGNLYTPALETAQMEPGERAVKRYPKPRRKTRRLRREDMDSDVEREFTPRGKREGKWD